MQGKKESFIYLFTKIIIGLFGIISVGVQTKYIDPAVLGDFSLITGFVGVLVSLFVGWLGSSGLRYYHQYNKNKEDNSFFTTIMVDWIIMLLVTFIVAFIGSYIFKSIPIKQYFGYVLIILLWSSLWEIYEKLMRASKHNIFYCIILLMQSLLNLAVIIVYHKITGRQIESLFWSKIVTTGLAVVMILIVLKVFKKIKIKSYSLKQNKVFFHYGFPMVGVWGVSWLLNYSDRYIINYFLSSEQVGLYDVAYRFSESSLGMIISAFNLAFFPAMIRTWNEEGPVATCNMLRNIFRYYFMFAIPAFIGIALLSNQFYGSILDIQYKEAAIVMSIASLGFVFMGINNTLYKLWQLEEKTNIVLYLTLVSVVINLVSNIIFIPMYGYIAAAITTVVSYLIITLIASIMVIKKFNFKLNVASLIKQIIAGVLMGVLILLVRPLISNLLFLMLIILLSVIVYFVVLFLLGDLSGELKDIKSKLKVKKHE